MTATIEAAAPSWRDYTDQLTPKQIETLASYAPDDPNHARAAAESNLRMARWWAEQNRLTATVATPPGTAWMSDSWELEKDGSWTRMVFGPTHRVQLDDDHAFAIGVDMTQDNNGSLSGAQFYLDLSSFAGPVPLEKADEVEAAILAAREDLARMTG